MGIFDKLTKIAEKAAEAVVQTSDKINQTYQQEGFDGIINKTADTLTKATQKTQNYFNTIGEKNKQIFDSIPDKDLEGTLAKATAVVINTTQTIVKDAATLTKNTVESVSKNLDQATETNTAHNSHEDNVSTQSEKTATTKEAAKTGATKKQLYLNDGEIAELDCMPIILFINHLGAEKNVDGQTNKFKLDGINFVTNNQKWYDFNNNKGGEGSLSFMNHYIRVQNNLLDNTNVEVHQEILSSSLDILSNIHTTDQYKKDLSAWIKVENAKKSTTDTPLAVEKEEHAQKVKSKRVRKPVEKLSANDKNQTVVETVAPKKSVKRTVKKPLVVEEQEVSVPKTTKKNVKKAVEETFTPPVVKSRKPKV